MNHVDFRTDALFSYRRKTKFRSGVMLITTALAVMSIAIVFIILQSMETSILPEGLQRQIDWIGEEIYSGKPFGIFALAFSGGLFFLFMPVDLIFLNFLRKGVDPVTLLSIYAAALIMAHTVNYMVGARLSALSKMLIPPRKFYYFKGLLNHYGPVVIFVVNALPLPSPILSGVLGAFRYNMIRFYSLFIPGQAVLYGSILLLHKFVFQHWEELF